MASCSYSYAQAYLSNINSRTITRPHEMHPTELNVASETRISVPRPPITTTQSALVCTLPACATVCGYGSCHTSVPYITIRHFLSWTTFFHGVHLDVTSIQLNNIFGHNNCRNPSPVRYELRNCEELSKSEQEAYQMTPCFPRSDVDIQRAKPAPGGSPQQTRKRHTASISRVLDSQMPTELQDSRHCREQNSQLCRPRHVRDGCSTDGTLGRFPSPQYCACAWYHQAVSSQQPRSSGLRH
jgi:hypothetical protein